MGERELGSQIHIFFASDDQAAIFSTPWDSIFKTRLPVQLGIAFSFDWSIERRYG
jgi:hypothetical protein